MGMVYLWLIVGFVLLIKGADFFVEGSSSVAKLLRVPSVIIGLTVVAFGTSAPELAVSVTAALTSNNGIALGNVIGSNMFNLLMVIGLNPAAVQAAYRIGDGMSNSLTPVSPNIVVNLAYAQKYDDRIQLGTMFANLVPLNVVSGLIWIAMLYVWCMLGIPLGPGYSPFL